MSTKSRIWTILGILFTAFWVLRIVVGLVSFASNGGDTGYDDDYWEAGTYVTADGTETDNRDDAMYRISSVVKSESSCTGDVAFTDDTDNVYCGVEL